MTRNESIENEISHDAMLAMIKKHDQDFIHIIRDRLGLVIHSHQLNELHKTILDACLRLNCFPQEYLHLLNNKDPNSDAFDYLIKGITVGETYFFRDSNQMRLLEKNILPSLIEKKRALGDLSLRIWSAGCASGEEIYTIAIMLNEILPDIASWSLHLLGTDINTQSMKKALNGIYNEWSMRSISEKLKKHYFTKNHHQYIIDPKILNAVHFSYLNLNDDIFPSIQNETNAQDLILCRNVLIYFDSIHIARLMKKLSMSLSNNGYLILGASDPVNIVGCNLKFHYKQGIFFTHLDDNIKTTTIVPKKIEKNKSISSSFHLKEKMITHKPRIEKQTSLDNQYENIKKLLKEENWQSLYELMNVYSREAMNSVFILEAYAMASANLGKLEQAVNLCNDCLRLEPANIKMHFTLAMAFVELNKIKEAEDQLRKTLFLDHQFVEGHFQLGLLYFRNKQIEKGLKCLKNALQIVKTKNPEEMVSDAKNLNYQRLSEIIQNEIEMHEIKGEKNETKTLQ